MELPPAAKMSNADLLRHAPQIVKAGFRRGLLSIRTDTGVSTECPTPPPMPSQAAIDQRMAEDQKVCEAWEISRPMREEYPNTPKGSIQYRKEYQAWALKRLRAREKAAGGKVQDLRFVEGVAL